MPPRFNLNSKTIQAPLAAFCMASILFVYARTSIQAAKRNAQQHREADGGQINWHNESLRRHGKLESPVPQSTVTQLVSTAREKVERVSGKVGDKEETEAEKRIRERRVRGRDI